MLQFIVCCGELLKRCIRCSCVFARGWICRDDAGVSVEDDECVLVAMFVSGIVFGQDNAVGCQRLPELFRYESLVGNVLVRGGCRWMRLMLSSARGVLRHGARADLAVGVFRAVGHAVHRIDGLLLTVRKNTVTIGAGLSRRRHRQILGA
eukprot:639156-Pyramimonas_sp.AAC.1